MEESHCCMLPWWDSESVSESGAGHWHGEPLRLAAGLREIPADNHLPSGSVAYAPGVKANVVCFRGWKARAPTRFNLGAASPSPGRPQARAASDRCQHAGRNNHHDDVGGDPLSVVVTVVDAAAVAAARARARARPPRAGSDSP